MRPPAKAPSGWTAPTAILTALSLISSAGWAWVGLSTKQGDVAAEIDRGVETRLRNVEIAISRLVAQIEGLRAR